MKNCWGEIKKDGGRRKSEREDKGGRERLLIVVVGVNISYRMVFEKSLWKIVKGVMVIVLGIKFGILYIIVGCLSMIFVVDGISFSLYNIFGYMSEKWMNMLINFFLGLN